MEEAKNERPCGIYRQESDRMTAVERQPVQPASRCGVDTSWRIINLALFACLACRDGSANDVDSRSLAASVIENGLGPCFGLFAISNARDARTKSCPGILIAVKSLHNNHHTYPTTQPSCRSSTVESIWADCGFACSAVLFGLAKVRRIMQPYCPHQSRASSIRLDWDIREWPILNKPFQIMGYRNCVSSHGTAGMHRVTKSVRHLFVVPSGLLSRESSTMDAQNEEKTAARPGESQPEGNLREALGAAADLGPTSRNGHTCRHALRDLVPIQRKPAVSRRCRLCLILRTPTRCIQAPNLAADDS